MHRKSGVITIRTKLALTFIYLSYAVSLFILSIFAYLQYGKVQIVYISSTLTVFFAFFTFLHFRVKEIFSLEIFDDMLIIKNCTSGKEFNLSLGQIKCKHFNRRYLLLHDLSSSVLLRKSSKLIRKLGEFGITMYEKL